jgi:hypothetical protein
MQTALSWLCALRLSFSQSCFCNSLALASFMNATRSGAGCFISAATPRQFGLTFIFSLPIYYALISRKSFGPGVCCSLALCYTCWVLCQSIETLGAESGKCWRACLKLFPIVRTREHQKIALDTTTLSPLLALGASAAGEHNAEFIFCTQFMSLCSHKVMRRVCELIFEDCFTCLFFLSSRDVSVRFVLKKQYLFKSSNLYMISGQAKMPEILI